MPHRRCCDDPTNLTECSDAEGRVLLVCIECGATVARADDRGELYADY